MSLMGLLLSYMIVFLIIDTDRASHPNQGKPVQEHVGLAWRLWGNGPEPGASYLYHQYIKGYKGPLCTICPSGHGVSVSVEV